MPWKIEERAGRYCVVKKNGDGSSETVHCHSDKKRATAQLRALYASEGKTGKELTAALMDHQKDVVWPDGEYEATVKQWEEQGYIPYGPTSFAELEREKDQFEQQMEMMWLAGDLVYLMQNIIADPEVENKGNAMHALVDEFVQRSAELEEGGSDEEKAKWSTAKVNDLPDGAFLYVESGEKDGDGKTTPRSKRHFPYKDSSGKVDLPHLRNAIARIPQSNAPGLTPEKKRSLQARARKLLANATKEVEEQSLFQRVIDGVKERFGLMPKENNGFMVWKDTETGNYRWLAVYSNKYRDQDFPPEILSSQAHKDFISRVEKGEDPYPELWHWHIPGTQWGQTDWMAYTDEGFALASGYVLPGHEKEAEALMGMAGVRTSHGMPIASIERSADDQTVITRYSSKEISDLPATAAANMLTDFSVLEVPMPIPDNKKDYLRRVGMTDASIESVERALGEKAKAAEVLGMEHKSAEASDEAQAEAKQEGGDGGMQEVAQPEAKEAPTTATEPKEEVASPSPENQPPTRKELTEILGPVLESLKTLAATTAALTEQFKEFKAQMDAEQEKKTAPEQSVPSLLAAMLGLSPVGKDAAAVKGNDPSARGPKETEPTGENTRSKTGIPLIDYLTTPVPKE